MMLISRGRNDFEVHLGCPPFEPRGIRFLPRLISPTVAQVFDVRSPVFVTNTWMHMVASYQKSGSLGRLYLNGRELTTTSYTGGDGPPDIRSLKLGTRYDGALGGGVPFKGAMDDVRVYNRALSAQEVMGLYDLEFPDSDHDGLSDWEEINIYHTDPNKKDTDGDGLTDYQEVFVYHTDPTKADSDDDGFNDYAEIYSGHDPLNTTNFPAANLSLFTAIELEFISKTGTVYQIQASPDLTTWTNFDGPILGDGNIWKKTYSIRGSPSLFYRVELAP
jgi:hypothetical protein